MVMFILMTHAMSKLRTPHSFATLHLHNSSVAYICTDILCVILYGLLVVIHAAVVVAAVEDVTPATTVDVICSCIYVNT